MLRAAPVRSVYRESHGGQEPELWEENWRGVKLPLAVRELNGSPTPLVNWLSLWTTGAGRVLEAGCGAGTYVAVLAGQGRTVVGVDFAAHAVSRAKLEMPSLLLATGDVQHLPFPDGAFDRIISLGVIEHFVEGPDAVLAEHLRVLAPSGALVLTVPRLSPLKRWADFRALAGGSRPSYVSRRGLVVTRSADLGAARPRLREDGGSGEARFYQYEVSKRVLERTLLRCGFRPEAWAPFATNFDAIDTAFLRRLVQLRRAPAERPTEAPPSRPESAGPSGAGRTIRDALLDDRGPISWRRPIVLMAQHLAGHMHFVVARAR